MSDKPLGITELIAKVGDENITVQNLLHSSPNITKHKNDASVKFYTSIENGNDLMRDGVFGDGKYVFLVVRIPKSKLPKE